MWTQCVQRNPTIRVPTKPKSRPPFLKAFGIAKIPVPSELFNRCIREPIVLKKKKETHTLFRNSIIKMGNNRKCVQYNVMMVDLNDLNVR